MVKLDDLGCAEIKRVVKHRWERFSSERLPFDEGGLDKVFDGKRRPLVRVVAIMEALLVDKVDEKTVERWPDPALEYDTNTLKQRVSFWDSRVRRKARHVPGP